MIGFEIIGDKELNNYLANLADNKLKNIKQIGIAGIKDIQLHFRNSQGQNGKWKSLKYRSGKPLQLTGALQQSVAERILIHSDKKIEIGTNLKYAKIHNYGGLAGRNKKVEIPKREFMWLSTEFDNNMTKILFKSWEGL